MNPKPQRSPNVDLLPPHDPDMERAVLGCILLEPQTVIGRCLEVLEGGSDAFYDLRHQTIYDACVGLWQQGIPADVISTVGALKTSGKLEQVGGIGYVMPLPDCAATALAVDHYLESVRQKHLLRRIIRACTQGVEHAYAVGGSNPDEVLDCVEADILKIRSARTVRGDTPIRDLIRGAIGQIEAEHQAQGKLSGVPTGFADLDKLTNGFQNSHMIVIAARPSLGKTSFLGNIIEHAAVDLGLPVGVFSLEMSDQSIVKRLLCSRARVNARAARDGFLVERDFPKLTVSAGKISRAPIFINDTGGLSIMQIRAKARRWHREHGIRLLGIDYLQLANAAGGGKRFDSRQQEITEISMGIKNIAKELDIPVVVLSQLNRDVERRRGGRPVLSDLRESGAIEQDADFVGFLYRPEQKEDEANVHTNAIPVNLYVAKHRDGDTGVDINLTFLKSITRFESAARIRDEDVPQDRQPRMPYA